VSGSVSVVGALGVELVEFGRGRPVPAGSDTVDVGGGEVADMSLGLLEGTSAVGVGVSALGGVSELLETGPGSVGLEALPAGTLSCCALPLALGSSAADEAAVSRWSPQDNDNANERVVSATE
jgi:hypothetical protein